MHLCIREPAHYVKHKSMLFILNACILCGIKHAYYVDGTGSDALYIVTHKGFHTMAIHVAHVLDNQNINQLEAFSTGYAEGVKSAANGVPVATGDDGVIGPDYFVGWGYGPEYYAGWGYGHSTPNENVWQALRKWVQAGGE